MPRCSQRATVRLGKSRTEVTLGDRAKCARGTETPALRCEDFGIAGQMAQQFKYRIRHSYERHERVAKESELSRH